MGSRITFQFKKHGYEVVGEVGENSLFVDVGNNLKAGIIDHHQFRNEQNQKDVGSTVKVFDIKYLKHLLYRNDSVVIYTHTHPDSDSVLSTYMAKYVLTNGEVAFNDIFGTDNYGYKLVEYVDEIDRGYGKKVILNSEKASFYVAICFLDRIACAMSYCQKNNSLNGFNYVEFSRNLDRKERTKCDQLALCIGHKLIDEILNRLKENPNITISEQSVEWTWMIENKEVCSYIVSLYKSDYEKYCDEKETSINFEDIAVWGKNGKIYEKKIKAAIWREIPQSEFSYLYARQEDDVIITVIPGSIKEKNDPKKPYSHVIISMDPENEISHKVTLKPLAEALELMEQIEENSYYQASGSWRRDHSRFRKGFAEAPFVSTADPWFFTPDELLVEAPGKHSIIEYGSIISLIERHTKLIESVNSAEYRDENFLTPIENGKMTISKWINHVSNLISDHVKDDTFDVILTEVDPVMIKSRNDVLKAMCMSVLGNNVFEAKDTLELDYYSCIYANDHFMLTIMANDSNDNNNDYRADVNNNGRRLYSLVEKNNANFKKDLMDKISGIAKKVINQRNMLMEMGGHIDECVGDATKSKGLYRDFVQFIALEQKDSVIGSLVEREIYDYLRKVFKVENMKESIQDSVDIVTTDAKERIYSKFNNLATLTIPFVLISTIFQIGMIHLEPLLSSNGFNCADLVGWLFFIGIGVVLYIFLKIRKE